jgi:lipoate-protein ligase A
VSFRIEASVGSAAAFHQRVVPEPVERAVWVHEVSEPALVLGSTQPLDSIDAAACSRRGIEVVRRRSGGAAVLLLPGGALWVDVVIPADDPLWDHDIGRSSGWLGALWAAALADGGATGAVVHQGPMVRTDWSPVLCFAGLGPGEVTVAGRKVVGISQRRTRSGARFQCAVMATWDVDTHLELLAPAWRTHARGNLAVAASGPGMSLEALRTAVLTRLRGI